MTDRKLNDRSLGRNAATVIFCALSLWAIAVPRGIIAIAQQIPTVNRPTLQLGSSAEAVTELQAVLKLMGYYQGAVNGVYGESTAIAVSAFQRDAGLTPDGVVGDRTWNRLFPPSPEAIATPVAPAQTPVTPASNYPILRRGMEGDTVVFLQERLRQLGFFEGAPTGVFGPRTETSVLDLQRRYNLSPDGIVGPTTWSVLLQ